MNFHNRIALLLALIFTLLMLIVGLNRVWITKGELEHAYAPTLHK